MNRNPGFSARIHPAGPPRLRAAFLALAMIGSGLLVLPGCYEDEHGHHGSGHAPAPPRELWTLTGDGQVTLFWLPVEDSELDGYCIYRSPDPDGYYHRIATLNPEAASFVDGDLEDGITYFYAVSSVNRYGDEGELSEPVYDTPRPQGEVALRNSRLHPEHSGYDFSRYQVDDYRDLEADIYFWSTDEAGPWMVATERSQDSYTDIQDAGYVRLDEIDRAPLEGWAPHGEVPLIAGHSYVVWTWDNRYAKFRVLSLTPDQALLEWAYQTDPGNRELSLPTPSAHATGGGLRSHLKGLERRIAS
jgi:hypothetical protein